MILPLLRGGRFSPTVSMWFQIFLSRHEQFDKWLKQVSLRVGATGDRVLRWGGVGALLRINNFASYLTIVKNQVHGERMGHGGVELNGKLF